MSAFKSCWQVEEVRCADGLVLLLGTGSALKMENGLYILNGLDFPYTDLPTTKRHGVAEKADRCRHRTHQK